MRLAALPLLALALTGCVIQTPAPEPAPPAPPVTSTLPAPANAEQIYVRYLTQQGVPLTQQEMTTIGPRICSAFDTGLNYGAVERGVLSGEPQLTQAQAGHVIGASIAAYCPQHQGKVTG